MMTVIEIRPHRWGWKCFEALGVEPVFLDQHQAIGYAEPRVLSCWPDSRPADHPVQRLLTQIVHFD